MDTSQEPVSPTTTLQEDLTTAGQRRINIVWEFTQSTIAIAITIAIIFYASQAVKSEEITNAFFLIVGFYFSRTNHQAIGGVGIQPTQPYQGR